MALRVLREQVAQRVLQDGRGSEGAQPIVVVGSDTIVDVSAVGIFTVKEETLDGRSTCACVDVSTRAGARPHPPRSAARYNTTPVLWSRDPAQPLGTSVNSELVLSSGFVAARWRYFRETQGRRARFFDVELHERAETPRPLGSEHFHQQVREN